MNGKGKLIIISGPSGSGKGTIVAEYMKRRKERTYLSVSATSRLPRENDTEGETYFFLSRESFEETAKKGGMLEYAEYCGNLYGTPKAPVEQAVNDGRDVILEIDIQGGFNVKKQMKDALLVFIMPPTAQILKKRLTDRGTDSAESISKRIAAASGEIQRAKDYDYILVNDDLKEAVDELERVVDGGLKNVDHMINFLKGVLKDVETPGK